MPESSDSSLVESAKAECDGLARKAWPLLSAPFVHIGPEGARCDVDNLHGVIVSGHPNAARGLMACLSALAGDPNELGAWKTFEWFAKGVAAEAGYTGDADPSALGRHIRELRQDAEKWRASKDLGWPAEVEAKFQAELDKAKTQLGTSEEQAANLRLKFDERGHTINGLNQQLADKNEFIEAARAVFEQVSLVYEHVAGLSKANTLARVIIAEHDDRRTKETEEAIAEATEELATQLDENAKALAAAHAEAKRLQTIMTEVEAQRDRWLKASKPLTVAAGETLALAISLGLERAARLA